MSELSSYFAKTLVCNFECQVVIIHWWDLKISVRLTKRYILNTDPN